MSSKKTSPGKWIALAAGVFCMLGTGVISPPAGLSQAGFQVLGILVGAIILFLSWGTGWPSMAIIFSLMTVPGLSAAQVTQATFGNNTVVFLLFCMMLAACLTKSGAARRIAIWFLTNKLARSSPCAALSARAAHSHAFEALLAADAAEHAAFLAAA